MPRTSTRTRTPTPADATTTNRSNAMPTTTTTRRTTPIPQTTPMANACLPSAPANDVETVEASPDLTLVHRVDVRSSAATPTRAPRPLPQPEEVVLLRASQVDNVAAEEIELFFAGDAENDDRSAQARAVIGSWIAKLDPRDQQALALYYEPEPWPASILEEGLDHTSGYALVLSNASAAAWRRDGRRHYGAEQTANEQLRAAVLAHGPRALRYLTRRAEWDFATALRAYAKARGRAPSALCRSGREPRASEGS